MKSLLLLSLCAKIVTATLFTSVFIPPGPIISFSSYLTTPSNGMSPNTTSGSQSIYTAVQLTNSVVMSQVLVANRPVGTEWELGPTWCCDKNGQDWVAPQMLVENMLGKYKGKVNPGTVVYSSQSLNVSDNNWNIVWKDAGGSGGDPIPDGQISLPSYQSLSAPFTRAIFGLDIATGTLWDFGSVKWSNIQIVVNTQSTDDEWCVSDINAGGQIRNDVMVVLGNRSMDHTVDGHQNCTISSLVMNMPFITAKTASA